MKKTLSHRIVAGLFALLLGSLSCSRQTTPPAASVPLVLRGGLLINGTGSDPLQNSVIVISDGKIESVGREGSAQIPADATVIDAVGKTIIPGLVDSHIHMRNLMNPFFLYWGITTVGDMGNPRGWIFAERREVEAGRSVGPYIMAVGSMLNAPIEPGEPASRNERNGYDPSQFVMGNSHHFFITDDASIEARIRQFKEAGADAIKLYTRVNPELMRKAANIAHDHGLKVFAHYTNGNARGGLFQGVDEMLDTGLDMNVHLYGLIKSTVPTDVRDRIAKGENLSDVYNLMDENKLLDLARRMAETKMFLNPTLHGFARLSRHRAEFEEAHKAFLNGPLAKLIPEKYLPAYAEVFAPPKGDTVRGAEGFRKVGVFLKEFVNRGGRIAAGADTGEPMGLSMHAEMQLLQESGLTPMQAIQAATSWGMEAWGKADVAGTIEPGKRADLLILNRNPLEDIAATREIDTVIQGGKIVDRTALASSKDTLPRPTPDQSGVPNNFYHVPFINEVFPDRITGQPAGSVEITVRGENFSANDVAIFNGQMVPLKFTDQGLLTISIGSVLPKTLGTYPLIIMHTGSAGVASNVYYIVVQPE